MKPIFALLVISSFLSCQSKAPLPKPLLTLQTVYTDSTYQLTGVAVSKTGRLFTNYPRWSSTYRNGVVEIKNGKPVPFPDSAYNNWAPQDSGLKKWICAMAVTIDDQDNLWVVDPASPQLAGVIRKTALLRNPKVPTSQIVAQVEILGHFTTTDGMVMDKNGNLYLGDLEKSAIIRIDSSLHQTTLVSDPRLIWPDSYQITDDGYLYISCSQIQQQPGFNAGANQRTSPYTIFRVKLPD
jgi:hypothetical protein